MRQDTVVEGTLDGRVHDDKCEAGCITIGDGSASGIMQAGPLTHTTAFTSARRNATSDNRLTLFGFRRFRTSHLLNLRLLESEIETLDHAVFQNGLELEHLPVLNRLGLKHAKKEVASAVRNFDGDRHLVPRLRALIKEYGAL